MKNENRNYRNGDNSFGGGDRLLAKLKGSR
jgi:hypothetical protein